MHADGWGIAFFEGKGVRLFDEVWETIPAGTLCEFQEGECLRKTPTQAGVRKTP